MRINQFVAQAGGLSRRASDQAISSGRVSVNGKTASIGQRVSTDDVIKLDGKTLVLAEEITIMLNKPIGYVCSRNGQGAKTIYDLLPPEYQNLKPIGRLDKDSSGLLLLTNDGMLAQELTHPSFEKTKVYEIELDKPLTTSDRAKIEQGIKVEDYISELELKGVSKSWTVKMHQGKNRQIRRTFAALDYTVTNLHRASFGNYKLDGLPIGKIRL